MRIIFRIIFIHQYHSQFINKIDTISWKRHIVDFLFQLLLLLLFFRVTFVVAKMRKKELKFRIEKKRIQI